MDHLLNRCTITFNRRGYRSCGGREIERTRFVLNHKSRRSSPDCLSVGRRELRMYLSGFDRVMSRTDGQRHWFSFRNYQQWQHISMEVFSN